MDEFIGVVMSDEAHDKIRAASVHCRKGKGEEHVFEYAFREHGDAIRGEDDEQPWNAATPLSGAEIRVEVCLAEARYVERRVPFVDLPGSVRRAKAAVDAGDESGWTPVADGPAFRYVRALREDGVERAIPSDLRLRTLYTVELVCSPGRSVVLVEEGLRGRLADVASKAVESARVSATRNRPRRLRLRGVVGLGPIGRTCERMRSHARMLNASRAPGPHMVRRELPTTTALPAWAND